MNIESIIEHVDQPPLLDRSTKQLTVIIAGLALGGAEKIVLDWARRVYPKWTVHVVALRDHEKELVVPSYIKVTRLHGKNILLQLKQIAQVIRFESNSICLCHLLTQDERKILLEEGITAIPVLHNAQQGWREQGSCLVDSPQIIAVSEACKYDLAEVGINKNISVIRHIPFVPTPNPLARNRYRTEWNIPVNATVIGMVGAVKPQKNYLFALRILKEMLVHRDVYLVIVGGPIGKNGRNTWEMIIKEIHHLGLRHRVAMTGFIPDATSCLPAFDLLLNTSLYEGLSIATLEALVSGLPVIASGVGGQGEVNGDALVLIPENSSVEMWVDELEKGLVVKCKTIPSWARFPSYRLWTLAHLAKPFVAKDKVLFVTANLNSGGAQRSLVNLAKEINKNISLEIAVTGNSTTSYFYQDLTKSGVRVLRTDEVNDAFVHAEVLVQKICTEKIGTVCFWNLDSKIKLLLVKTLGFTNVRFIDVSPGDNSFDELQGIAEFQQLICYTSVEYYQRLNQLVLKYHGTVPLECIGKTVVIPNGIPASQYCKTDYSIKGNPKIVVNGRIAPTKFLHEIIIAVKMLWKTCPDAELHFYGGVEPRHYVYAESIYEVVKEDLHKRVFFHGFDFDAKAQLSQYDAYVVLGKDQGCPNALLEALSVGMPAVANDNGGTREQVINNQTGLLIADTAPSTIYEALLKLISQRQLAQRLGLAGKEHVMNMFSMQQMAGKYLAILQSKNTPLKNNQQTKKILFTQKRSYEIENLSI